MKKQKAQQGITLIALIITIVVLLILAVVTINAVREGGIITHAQDAANEYKIAQEKEQIALAYSEYLMNKRTNPNATLEVKGATVSGSEEDGWEVTFDKTNNAYEVNSDGNITYIESGAEKGEDDADIVIAAEKDLATVGYFYNTMYDSSQPVAREGYDDDENNDKISDVNLSLGAYASSYTYDIPVAFFSEAIPIGETLTAKITHYDGTTEEITFKEEIWVYYEQEVKKEKIVWEYESKGEGVWGDNIEIRFIPYAKYSPGGRFQNRYINSNEYHCLEFSDCNAMSFKRIELLGKTIEYPFNCQAYVGFADSDFYENMDPVYNDINKVSKVIVNYSDNTQKIYTTDNIFDANLYYGEDSCFYYSSQDVPILYTNGAFIINMSESSFKTQIKSIVVEEDGVATKYNVTDSTEITNSYAWN